MRPSRGRCDQGPALARGHRRRVSASRRSVPARRRRVSVAVRRLHYSAMPGPVALVGAGEFLPAMAEFDAGLLAATGRSAAARRDPADRRPRPTARTSSAAGRRWASPTSRALGAEVEPVLVRDVAGADDPAAAQAIGEADLIYLSGGKPALPARRARRSAVGERARGAPTSAARSLAGCSAGAMALVGRTFDFRFIPSCGCRAVPAPLAAGARRSWPDVAVVPHYDAWPEPLSALIALQAPRGVGRPRHRRGHRRRRPGRRLAGPRRSAGSRSGAAATASASGRATRSGSEAPDMPMPPVVRGHQCER